MLFTLLTLVLALSLLATCASIPAAQPQPQSPPSSTTPIPASASDSTDGLQTVNPVDMGQLCQQPAYYCIYVDQVRAGIVHASPVNATDRQGGFLFERKAYLDQAFHVCFGGSCIDLDFKSRPGCVTMNYVARESEIKGHLLARFADNVQNIIGPRQDMLQMLIACPNNDQPLPYAVIGPRGGAKKQDQKQDKKEDKKEEKKEEKEAKETDTGVAAKAAVKENKSAFPPTAANITQPGKLGHNYFDDVTVPLVDA
ncbi:hypothetical protein NDA14_002636 [Ustilago hordei]|uniref:Mig1 protein n=1 Tax=Ustilago hordei TaxID=120017 RepID=I2FYA6_USTHO|nr:uncharacterized protein UHO2_04052 [Ustilago hordei]KAJ1037245.1 hypothetical protein NDA10_003208 [Ustilago hordei]KAJ1580149.1 hypothetical protein NDA15_007461 [Ustilago hordei]KAJ1581682.1 hypothetical protein NDA12_000234 [Ustilago hordei]KAJ1600157.1 hypothetical protein NDA14_002636 [Ustilago hordei]UTT91593.1 hypothetical protein NDA17_007599 [Ustilago hordei]